ncbi:MAG: hypothetical protein WBO55_01635 [Rhizobiaceae bacterium]
MLDRRQLLALLLFLAAANPAIAKDGESGGNSGPGGGENSGTGGGDDGEGDDGGEGQEGEEGESEVGGGTSSSGKGRTEWDRARQAVRSGEVIPLQRALEIVSGENIGRVIDVSFRQSLFGRFYAFKLKTTAGRIRTLQMDARTGRILRVPGS